MCGIAGLLEHDRERPVRDDLLDAMVGILRHRGPDDAGTWRGPGVGLGSTRLSIVDLETGHQPIRNEDGSVWVVFNGEIFNHAELRARLSARGHRFYTRSDTEVLVHLYEDEGPEFLGRLNGDFALALWDARRDRLLLARDRIGVRPLFYATADGCFTFASEVKALFLNDRLPREVDPRGVDQVFTFWAALPPQTIFRGVKQIPPGHYLLADRGGVVTRRYWRLSFPPADGYRPADDEEYVERIRETLVDATRLRLQADVPVGVYLSGGIDSSVLAGVVRGLGECPLTTFSVRFADDFYDETPYQQAVVKRLGADHRSVTCTGDGIGEVFPDVVWHAETPMLRTAPAPLYLLSRLVHEHGMKVVLTGEGADEVFLGYDLFKETKLRRYWAQHPGTPRTALLRRLYPYLTVAQVQSPAYLEAFFGAGRTALDEPHYSHLVTWGNTSKAKKFFSKELRDALTDDGAVETFKATLPEEFAGWHPLAKAQYIEMTLLLAGYLLASQGDRMAMAHAVEGRFPYLDHRLIELAAAIPPHAKLRGLQEKRLLKKAFAADVPAAVRRRSKKGYRAPGIESFFRDGRPLPYVEDALSPARLREVGCFDVELVDKLIRKYLTKGRVMGEVDNMAFVGLLSLQMVHRQLIASPRETPPDGDVVAVGAAGAEAGERR
jgi:asparagine synthase (glutamine-hydrolysing)